MNAIAFCLDLILASLLLAALFVGLRLDRKLKVLKDSQSGFANAVAELDAAIVKAQDGLSALKATAVQAETAIADRIQDARGMTARLDQQSAAAKTAADKLERLLERYPSGAAGEGRDPAYLAMRDRIGREAAPGRLSPIAREALSRLPPLGAGRLDPGVRRDERVKEPAPADDELFDVIEPVLRAARGGR